jgi:hypothetical protein
MSRTITISFLICSFYVNAQQLEVSNVEMAGYRLEKSANQQLISTVFATLGIAGAVLAPELGIVAGSIYGVANIASIVNKRKAGRLFQTPDRLESYYGFKVDQNVKFLKRSGSVYINGTIEFFDPPKVYIKYENKYGDERVYKSNIHKMEIEKTD